MTCQSKPPQNWNPLEPLDSDSFSFDASAILAEDGSSLIATGPAQPTVAILEPDGGLIASGIIVTGNVIAFTLTAGPAPGEYIVTITFYTTTRGPITVPQTALVSNADPANPEVY